MFLSPPVCVMKDIVTAKPKWFPFTIKLLIGLVEVNKYLGGGYYYLVRGVALEKFLIY